MHYGRITSLVHGRNGPEPGRAEGNAMRINVLGQRILAGDPDPSVPASPGRENWPAGAPFRYIHK
jgi:hypothetical protein